MLACAVFCGSCSTVKEPGISVATVQTFRLSAVKACGVGEERLQNLTSATHGMRIWENNCPQLLSFNFL